VSKSNVLRVLGPKWTYHELGNAAPHPLSKPVAAFDDGVP